MRIPKMGIVSGPTLGMPNCAAQFSPRLSGSRVDLRRFQPNRTSLMVRRIDDVGVGNHYLALVDRNRRADVVEIAVGQLDLPGAAHGAVPGVRVAAKDLVVGAERCDRSWRLCRSGRNSCRYRRSGSGAVRCGCRTSGCCGCSRRGRDSSSGTLAAAGSKRLRGIRLFGNGVREYAPFGSCTNESGS